MAYVATQGVWMPAPPSVVIGTTFTNDVLIDATGEKIAFIGRVWNKDRATKNITKVGFRFGSVTKAGGSALTVSLQDVNAAAGPPYQPDETQDQTVAIANADAAFASNTWVQTGALSAVRAVAFGELLALVIEYDGGGRLGADSVALSRLSGSGLWTGMLDTSIVLKTGGTWAQISGGGLNGVVLEFDDGTFGTLDTGWPVSALSSTTFNNTSGVGATQREVALQFTVPFVCKVDGAWLQMQAAASADFSIVLYEGTSALATVATDSNAVLASASNRLHIISFAEQTLVPETTYYLALKPTTANNVVIYEYSVNDANHFQAHPGGTSWQYTSRDNSGAWAAPTATKRPWAGIRISALSDTVSGSSGGGRVIGG